MRPKHFWRKIPRRSGLGDRRSEARSVNPSDLASNLGGALFGVVLELPLPQNDQRVVSIRRRETTGHTELFWPVGKPQTYCDRCQEETEADRTPEGEAKSISECQREKKRESQRYENQRLL